MKKNIFILLWFLTGLAVQAQIHEPVKWSTAVEKLSDNEYDIHITATIEEKWHLYSQDVKEDGPIPTSFTFEDSDTYQLIGKTKEEEGIVENDPVFDMPIKYFVDKAIFTQRIKLLSEYTKINAVVEFMVCNNTQCLPPTEVDLVFEVPSAKKEQAAVQVAAQSEKVVEKEDINKENTNTTSTSKMGLWSTFILSFLFGFTALLTPCVFPLIPLTVSFFTKQSKTKAAGIKNAVTYGVFIVVIYVLLGVVVSAIFGPSALNALSTNVWFNLIFFILLIVFAVSFLGAFEITLPQSWANKVDSQSNRSGLVGIFFMALALAIVSFSCTGPIVGTILVEAASGGNKIGPIVGMFGFSLAIALPFALFAAFPGWLNSLPKSGGWLNTVKVVLGFLELALAFKFLSQADLVLQLHWLEREVFIAIWIAVFGTLALYLFGKIKLPHDSPLSHISVGRLCLGLLVLTFTVYMIPGLWGAPLNLISAFPPPQEYSESPYGVGFKKSGGQVAAHGELPDGAHLLAPHDILAFNDYDKGLAYAKKVNKPVLLDFTGWACVNCRKMEQNVWPDPKVLSALKNDVVLISLYVDDQRSLEKEEFSKLRPGKKFKNIGQKWSEFQTIRYKSNSQPYYVLMGHNEENLLPAAGYMPDATEYYNWIQKGVEKF